jgi:hypothetical protein
VPFRPSAGAGETDGDVAFSAYAGPPSPGVSLAAKASFDAAYDDKEASATKAAYLGTPDAQGNRAAYDLPECVA